jgi:hypothetical protein
LSSVWQALYDSLAAIRRHAAHPRQSAATDLGSSGGGSIQPSGPEGTGTEGT